MFKKPIFSLLTLIGVSCSPLTLAGGPTDVCVACEAGSGAFSTLNAQLAACHQCRVREQAFADYESQPAPPPPPPPPTTPPRFWGPELEIALGGGWSRPSSTGSNTVNSAGDRDVFQMNSATNSYLYGGDFGFSFLGGENWVHRIYLAANSWEIGNYNNAITHTYDGSILHGTYSANIPVEVFTALFNASIDIYDVNGFSPFVGGGAGWGYALTSSFTETHVSDDKNDPATFGSHTNSQFAYDVMAGFHYRLADHWRMQLAYMYLPIGTIETGTGSRSAGADALPALSEKLISNNVLLSVHYLF